MTGTTKQSDKTNNTGCSQVDTDVTTTTTTTTSPTGNIYI